MAAVDYMMEELGTKTVILENLDMEDFLKERDTLIHNSVELTRPIGVEFERQRGIATTSSPSAHLRSSAQRAPGPLPASRLAARRGSTQQAELPIHASQVAPRITYSVTCYRTPDWLGLLTVARLLSRTVARFVRTRPDSKLEGARRSQ